MLQSEWPDTVVSADGIESLTKPALTGWEILAQGRRPITPRRLAGGEGGWLPPDQDHGDKHCTG